MAMVMVRIRAVGLERLSEVESYHEVVELPQPLSEGDPVLRRELVELGHVLLEDGARRDVGLDVGLVRVRVRVRVGVRVRVRVRVGAGVRVRARVRERDRVRI